MLTYEAVGAHVVVRPDSSVEVRASGLFVVNRLDDRRPDTGTVISVGPGRITRKGVRVPPEVKAGDRVLFPKYGVQRIDDHVFLDHDQILTVLEA